MSDDNPMDEPTPYRDSPELHGRHFLTCRTMWYDPNRPGASFGLGGVYTRIEPLDGSPFPILLERVFVYFQLWGDSGEYSLRIRLVKLMMSDDDEFVETQLGDEGEALDFPMPSSRPAVVSELDFVNEMAFPIGPVPFQEPGLYEYQLWAEGIDAPIARERVFAQE